MSRKKRIYIYVNGILTKPGESENWTGRAVTRTMLDTEHRAEKVEYMSYPTFSRLMGQRDRVKKLARTISYYVDHGYELVLAGHSNGGGVVVEAMRYLEWPKVLEVHLLSPASERDFHRNGLRLAQDRGRIGKVFVYVAGKDTWLKIASLFVGRLFGYGTLGRDGPKNHCTDHTVVVHRRDWGHSDWWTEQNFPWTMRRVLGTNNGREEDESV